MTIKYVEYICPTVLLVLIFVLKLLIDEEFSFERMKRLIVETTVDIMSLAVSFMASYLIGSVSQGADVALEGVAFFIIYMVLLIIIVACSKIFIRKYNNTEKLRYWCAGIIIGYPISIGSLCYSIILLRNLWGLQ